MAHEMPLTEWIDESSDALLARLCGSTPEIGIVLGSGLGNLANSVEDAIKIPFSEVPHMRCSTATGHVGVFVFGSLGGKAVVCMQGRLHGYEGYCAQEVAYPIWLMHSLGVDTLITTNAAGAINESYNVGDFCIMCDHINMTGRNPVAGIQPDKLAPRFFSMYDAYDANLRKVAVNVAEREGIPYHEGVYLGLLGPSFETPAEIRAFRLLGADTVAMSVCEEVIAARHVGMRVCGISLCSNMACGIEDASPSDAEVFEVASRAEDGFCRLVTGIVTDIARR